MRVFEIPFRPNFRLLIFRGRFRQHFSSLKIFISSLSTMICDFVLIPLFAMKFPTEDLSIYSHFWYVFENLSQSESLFIARSYRKCFSNVKFLPISSVLGYEGDNKPLCGARKRWWLLVSVWWRKKIPVTAGSQATTTKPKQFSKRMNRRTFISGSDVV